MTGQRSKSDMNEMTLLGHSDWLIYALENKTGHVYYLNVETNLAWDMVAEYTGLVEDHMEVPEWEEENDEFLTDHLSMDDFCEWLWDEGKMRSDAVIGMDRWQRVKDMFPDYDLSNEVQIKNKFTETPPKFRYEWAGFQETHHTTTQFKQEHPYVAGVLLEMMLRLGIEKLNYRTDGESATITILNHSVCE